MDRSLSQGRIPSLDGLRALSICLVIALHSIQLLNVTHPVPAYWFAIFNGDTGVFIFFVISGYLITKLLLDEQQKRGSISIRNFYFRRAMRILPPIYVYIGLISILTWAGYLLVPQRDILSSVLFFQDYSASLPAWPLMHLWSLSIEEHFYLIWPFVIAYCMRRHGHEGRMLAAKVAVGVILIAPLIRMAAFSVHVPLVHNMKSFHIRADSLMFGCVAALAEGSRVFERIYAFSVKRSWLPPTVIFLSYSILLTDYTSSRLQNYWLLPFGFTICGAAIAIFLVWCVRNPESMVGKALNSAVVVRIGVLSYSLYIWQQLFLHFDNIEVFGRSLTFIGRFPCNLVAALLAAEVSYRCVEQPSLRLRNWLLRNFRRSVANSQTGPVGSSL